jgi:hypothetical protein
MDMVTYSAVAPRTPIDIQMGEDSFAQASWQKTPLLKRNVPLDPSSHSWGLALARQPEQK